MAQHLWTLLGSPRCVYILNSVLRSVRLKWFWFCFCCALLGFAFWSQTELLKMSWASGGCWWGEALAPNAVEQLFQLLFLVCLRGAKEGVNWNYKLSPKTERARAGRVASETGEVNDVKKYPRGLFMSSCILCDPFLLRVLVAEPESPSETWSSNCWVWLCVPSVDRVQAFITSPHFGIFVPNTFWMPFMWPWLRWSLEKQR